MRLKSVHTPVSYTHLDVYKRQGAHGVIIPKRRAAGLTATVAKTSAGALNYTPVSYTHLLYVRLIHKTMNRVPAVINIMPMTDLTVMLSCKKTKANMIVTTTLNLSTGTTFDASPICNAL